MKKPKYLFIILFSIIALVKISKSQSTALIENELLLKYWNLHDQFHKKYIDIGLGHKDNNSDFDKRGHSQLFDKKHNDWKCRLEYTGPYANGSDANSFFTMNTGDGTIKLGWYWVNLALEYKILKDEGKDTRTVLNEIYYALNAFNQLDLEAEKAFSKNQLAPRLDGFFVRDNLPLSIIPHLKREQYSKLVGLESSFLKIQEEGFFKQTYLGNILPEIDYCAEWDKFNNGSRQQKCSCQVITNLTDRNTILPTWLSLENGVFIKKTDYWNALYDDHTGGGAEVSQDQISYLVLGLAFLHKFVENIYIKPTNGDAGFFIDNEVKDITHRISIMLSQRVKHIERLKSGNNIHNYEFIAVR